MPAEHGCALGDLSRAQDRTTGSAWKARPPIDPVFVLKGTPPTLDSPVIADRAATKLDGTRQNLTGDLREFRHRRRRHTMRRTLWMKARLEKDLVHIDVAETSDPPLIQQQ